MSDIEIHDSVVSSRSGGYSLAQVAGPAYYDHRALIWVNSDTKALRPLLRNIFHSASIPCDVETLPVKIYLKFCKLRADLFSANEIASALLFFLSVHTNSRSVPINFCTRLSVCIKRHFNYQT